MRFAVRTLDAAAPGTVPAALRDGRAAGPERAAAYGLLAALMAEAGAGSVDALARDPFGRPFAPDRPDLHVSIAHCRRAVAAAVSVDWAVGIDVEEIAGYDRAVAELVLTPAQRRAVEAAAEPGAAFIRLWVRKEALGKAVGRGLEDAVLAAAVEQDRVTLDRRRYTLADLAAPPGMLAALAVAEA